MLTYYTVCYLIVSIKKPCLVTIQYEEDTVPQDDAGEETRPESVKKGAEACL